MHLICSMHDWLEDFQSSSLVALSLDIKCNFHLSSNVVTKGVCPETPVEHRGLLYEYRRWYSCLECWNHGGVNYE